MIWLLVPLMSWLSRMHGGGKPNLPWGLDAWILAGPYLLLYNIVGWWCLAGYAGAVLGLRLGHGRGFNYGEPFKEGSEPEEIEVFIPKRLPIHIQKLLVMVLTGAAVTLIPALLFATSGYYMAACILLASGVAKGACYYLPKTEWAEYTRGAFLGLGLALIDPLSF